MGKKRHSSEQIIAKLREAEVLQAKGATVAAVCKQIGVTEQTFYRWRKEYGGLRVDQAKKLKQLEKENQRLKKIVAEQALDLSIMKEAVEGNY
jgi:transposase-like protein